VNKSIPRTAFVLGGTLGGAGISSVVGGMGVAGGFGAVGISTIPMMAAGAIVGTATYGAFKTILQPDAISFGMMGIGAVGGASISTTIGGIGLVAPKIGLAIGIGTIPMTGIGAIFGLAAYGVVKMLETTHHVETPTELFQRMEEKVLYMDDYYTALLELTDFLSGEDLNRKFANLEVEAELEQLRHKIPKIKQDSETTSLNKQKPEAWRCLHTLKGHSAAVNSIAISPDGKIFASGSDDRTVRLWNLETGEWIYMFTGQAGAILSVSFSSDGNAIASAKRSFIASGSIDRTISTWHPESKKFIRTFFQLNSPYSHDGFVNVIAFSPNGILASGGDDKKIKLWGSYTGELKRALIGHEDAVLAIAFTADGKTLVSGSADKTIRIWNLENPTKPKVINAHSAAVQAVVISPDGENLISGSKDCSIKIWHLPTGELLNTLTKNSHPVKSLAISPDGKILASANHNQIELWQWESGRLIQTLPGMNPVVFSKNGKTLISGGKYGTIKIWHQSQDWENNTENDIPSGKWWEILGVEITASKSQVKQAYLELAKEYHPDLNNSDAAKISMQKINQAYQEFQKFN
jgi:WD40 repeat protein